MKQIRSWVPSALVSLLLVACGGGDPTVPGSGSPSGAPTTKGAFTAVVSFGDSLLDVGAYSPGANPRVDRALKVLPAVRRFLQQAPNDPGGELEATVAMLRAALELKEGDRV